MLRTSYVNTDKIQLEYKCEIVRAVYLHRQKNYTKRENDAFSYQYAAYPEDGENLKNVHVESCPDNIICFEAHRTRQNDLAHKAKVQQRFVLYSDYCRN
jgi:hypothetical protein